MLLAGLGVGEGLIDELEELAAVDYLHEWGAFGLAGDYPDRWSVFDADALTEGIVSFDQCGQRTLRIDGEGQRELVVGRELFGKGAQDFESGDGRLVGEDGVAVFVSEFLRLGVEPAGIDRSLETPSVEGQGKVMADPGNVVLGRGFAEKRIGPGAIGALHIFEFDDRDAGSGRGLQGRRIMDLGCGGTGGAAELSVGGGEQAGGGERKNCGTEQIIAMIAKHSFWTLSSKVL
jgi:hypothetical protein